MGEKRRSPPPIRRMHMPSLHLGGRISARARVRALPLFSPLTSSVRRVNGVALRVAGAAVVAIVRYFDGGGGGGGQAQGKEGEDGGTHGGVCVLRWLEGGRVGRRYDGCGEMRKRPSFRHSSAAYTRAPRPETRRDPPPAAPLETSSFYTRLGDWTAMALPPRAPAQPRPTALRAARAPPRPPPPRALPRPGPPPGPPRPKAVRLVVAAVVPRKTRPRSGWRPPWERRPGSGRAWLRTLQPSAAAWPR